MERNFNCSFENCSYKSNRSSNVRTHERTHTGDRPFKCEYPGCAYSAIHNSNLRTHVNSVHPPIITHTEAAKILLSFRNPKPDGKRRKSKKSKKRKTKSKTKRSLFK